MLHWYQKEGGVDSSSRQQSLQLMLRSKHTAHLNLPWSYFPSPAPGRQQSWQTGQLPSWSCTAPGASPLQERSS